MMKKEIELEIVAQTLYAEARGEGEEGLRAVGTVIMNRSKTHKLPLSNVCLQPKAFSCWNSGSTDIPIDEPDVYEICVQIADEMVSELFEPYPFKHINPTNYITVKLYNSRSCPTWAKDQIGEVVGNHIFFELQYW
jgi:spore germination cell wall hydrolase CwlJ-like protein